MVASARAELAEDGSDRFGEGWILRLHLAPERYVSVRSRRATVEKSVREIVNEVLLAEDDHVSRVVLCPDVGGEADGADDAGDGVRGPAGATSREDLLRLLQQQRDLMVAVSTGGPRINDVNQDYVSRRQIIQAALAEVGVADPVPYEDLWAWYGKWSSGDLPSYRSRREYLGELFSPLLAAVVRGPGAGAVSAEPTGWALVDRQLGEARRRLGSATTEEQYQEVGLLCRETMISLAQQVFDPAVHKSPDGVDPSPSDASRQLAAYFTDKLPGDANEHLRKHAKAALELASHVLHKRTGTFPLAAICVEACVSVVNLVAILSGRRDP
ncbi:MAG: hypothetical protein HY825_16045 [Acidobacteria bacterium]|nr:hypothetical protein [Acidobacteriota bacterium]